MTTEFASKKIINLTRQLARDKKVRDAESKFIIEGEKIILDAFSKNIRFNYFIASASYLKSHPEVSGRIASEKIPFYQVEDKIYESLSKLVAGPGIMGVADKTDCKICDLQAQPSYSVTLCDGIQDPANIGAMMRLAVAFGSDAMFLTDDSADIYNPKTIRASSGAVIDLPAYFVSWDEISKLKSEAKIFTAMPHGQTDSAVLDSIKDIPEKIILAFGSEGAGVSTECKKLTDTFFSIETDPGIESLNVAQSAAISLHYFKNLKKNRASGR